MKIITFEDIKETEREVHCPSGGFISYRYLLRSDGFGFSLHKTVIPKGEPQFWHYKNHLESCYCISGHGILTDLDNMVTHEILPGTVYALDSHDAHFFQALEETVLLCVFNPPLVGDETHSDDGSYRSSLEVCNG